MKEDKVKEREERGGLMGLSMGCGKALRNGRRINNFFIGGIVLYGVTQLVRHSIGMPELWYEFLIGAAAGMELFGVIYLIGGEKIKKIKLRLLKLCHIGR